MADINFESLNKPNLWSYIALAGYDVMTKKVVEDEDKVAREERKILEYIIKRAELPSKEINYILGNIQQALLNCGYEVRRVKIKAISLALVGVSETFGRIPFEVGLYFDPILNVPYIPGSTIKGVIRAGVFDLLSKHQFSEEKVKNECERLFGDNKSAGLIGFTDAYPIEKGEGGYLLYPDVMTPHYKNDTATELEVSPTPIVYLTIAPGTIFQFYLFYRRERGGDEKKRQLIIRNSQYADLAETPAQDLNRLGIVDLGLLYSFYKGVGAKTSIGYSKFEILSYESMR
ncbi:MAG: type III-B CRISPR module RAMP protein Cmr6 [Candidatus Methanomethylicia archaeon]